jgi:hypothetical protein
MYLVEKTHLNAPRGLCGTLALRVGRKVGGGREGITNEDNKKYSAGTELVNTK